MTVTKCSNKLPCVSDESEKKRVRFFCGFESAIGGKQIYINDR